MDTVMSRRFLQSEFWARFKSAHGWKPLFFTVTEGDSVAPLDGYGAETDGKETLTVLVRSFSLKLKRFSLAYIPMAPETGAISLQELPSYFQRLQKLASALKAFLPRDTLFVRFDPPIDFANLDDRKLAQKIPAQHGLTKICKSNVDIQPPDTVLLALDKDEEALLAAMKSKWRYNIRLAAKKGVAVSRHYATDSDFEEMFGHFYDLFQQTSERDGVSFHGRDYYLDLLWRGAPARTEGEKQPLITLYLAKHENDYLAGIITLFCEREAVYLYGASGNVKRNFMPAYLLQWTAIQDARKYGCPVYDFYGMPPTDDENHPMHGLYLFKTGFGGAIVHRLGSFDVALKPLTYKLYILAERLRAWFFKKARKKFRRR